MATTAFNTRKAVKTLKDAGVTAKAADAHVEVLMARMDTATSKEEYLKAVDDFVAAQKRIASKSTDLEEVTEGLVTREYLDVRLEALEHRISDKLTLRFGLMLTGAAAVLTFLEQVVFK